MQRVKNILCQPGFSSFYSEKRVKEDVYLIPFAMAELGFIKMKQNNAIEAKELLEPARYSFILIYFIHIYHL